MSGWLLETNVISELRRPRYDARVRAFVAHQPLEALFVSTVTFAEIRYGIEMVGDPVRRAELNDWLLHRVRPMLDQRCLKFPKGSFSSGACSSKTGARPGIPFLSLT